MTGSDLSFGSGQVTLAAAGTMQQVAPPPALDIPGQEGIQTTAAIIKALAGNTGALYVGPFNATTDWLQTHGFVLDAGDSVSMDVIGLGKLWFDGDNDGDKICILLVGP